MIKKVTTSTLCQKRTSQARKTYHWRNPHTGKEYSLGSIARREAIAQAIEANNYFDQNHAPSALLMKLQARPVMPFAGWLSNYEAILVRRNVKPATMRLRLYQLKSLAKHFGEQPLADITTRDVALFLESYITGGKQTMAVILRCVLNDIFREAIVAGIIEKTLLELRVHQPPKYREAGSQQKIFANCWRPRVKWSRGFIKPCSSRC